MLPRPASRLGGPLIFIAASLSCLSVGEAKRDSQYGKLGTNGILWENRRFETMGESWNSRGEFGSFYLGNCSGETPRALASFSLVEG
jgi:hypothetical protein